MNKRPLAPKFLNKLDNYLLLNKPDTWSTRFHLVFYYCLLFMITLAAICFVVPTDHREKSFYGLWSGSAGVLALIGFITWLVYLFRFNVFKQFGIVLPGDRVKTFVIYFFCIVMLSLSVYIPPVVESIRADMAYSSDELATDMNRVNELVTKIERNHIPGDFTADTIQIVSGGYDTQYIPSRPNFIYCDSSDLKWRLKTDDSVRWIRNDLFIQYHFFNLNFADDALVRKYAGVHVKTTLDLYHSAYLNQNTDVVAATRELNQLIDKYEHQELFNDFYYYNNNDYNSYDPNSIFNHIVSVHRIYEASSAIKHISERKYRLREAEYGDIAHATYYYALVLALLIFIFRHSTVKVFFLSLLTGGVLAILSGLCVAILNLREEGVYFLMLFYFLVFVVLSALIPGAKNRSVISGIALNAFVLLTAFIPLIVVGLYYSLHSTDYYFPVRGAGYDEFYAARTMSYHAAEIAGGVILLVMIETVFKRLYRKWYSLPED